MDSALKSKRSAIVRKIERYRALIKYYNDTASNFDVERPKGVDIIKAEEELPELRTQLKNIDDEY